jgi:hypothetical protein
MVYYFFQFDLHSLIFFVFILKLIFLSIPPFNSKIYSYSLIYFESFCIIDFFFSISSFDVWSAKDWVSQFFYAWCFQFNDPGHWFEELTEVDICFDLFSFSILLFDISVFFKNWFCGFFFIYIELSWSYDLDHVFYNLTRVSPPLIT